MYTGIMANTVLKGQFTICKYWKVLHGIICRTILYLFNTLGVSYKRLLEPKDF